MGGLPPVDQQELIEVNRRNLEAWGAGRAFIFTIVLKATQLPIGRIGIHVEAQEDVWFKKLGMRLMGENLCGFEKNSKVVPELEHAMTKEEDSNPSFRSNR
jgi:hypothetical protein